MSNSNLSAFDLFFFENSVSNSVSNSADLKLIDKKNIDEDLNNNKSINCLIKDQIEYIESSNDYIFLFKSTLIDELIGILNDNSINLYSQSIDINIKNNLLQINHELINSLISSKIKDKQLKKNLEMIEINSTYLEKIITNLMRNHLLISNFEMIKQQTKFELIRENNMIVKFLLEIRERTTTKNMENELICLSLDDRISESSKSTTIEIDNLTNQFGDVSSISSSTALNQSNISSSVGLTQSNISSSVGLTQSNISSLGGLNQSIRSNSPSEFRIQIPNFDHFFNNENVIKKRTIYKNSNWSILASSKLNNNIKTLEIYLELEDVLTNDLNIVFKTLLINRDKNSNKKCSYYLNFRNREKFITLSITYDNLLSSGFVIDNNLEFKFKLV